MKTQKVKILNGFRDKDNFAVVYQTGSEGEFTAERAEDLERIGLVELVGSPLSDIEPTQAEVKKPSKKAQPKIPELNA
jgi:hypothetical protein